MNIQTFLLIALLSVAGATAPIFAVNAQSELQGAWEFVGMEKGAQVTDVLFFSGNYFSWTKYETDGGAFLKTKGGSWQADGDQLVLSFEFNSTDSTQVGQSEAWTMRLEDDALILENNIVAWRIIWEKLDKGVKTDLTGAWLFSGRVRDGEVSRRDTNQPRKTMKILTGTHFQWIAYNTATGQFFGTGGGKYSAENGKYVENIEFFSRDNKRVGASLEFNFEVKDGEWHHTGKSSSGEPMYEIWAPRK